MQLDNLFDVIKTAGQKPFAFFVQKSTANNLMTSSSLYDTMSTNGFVFKQFDSLESAFNKKNEIQLKRNRVRYETKALEYVEGLQFKDYKSFMDYLNAPKPSFDKIKEISSKFIENVKTLINLGGLYKNDKITITEDTRGVFDFGLASLGLYRPIEFFSEELEKDINDKKLNNPFLSSYLENGVIDSNEVKKKSIGGLNEFYFVLNGKKYLCEKRQKGATKVFNNFPKDCFLKPNEDGIFITYDLTDKNKVFNGKKDIRLKYASSNKKSYLIYNKKDDSVKNVDIFMPINFLTNTVKNGARATALLPAFLISATLEEFGIQSRISALRLGSDTNTQITVSIPVKDYQESSKECFDRIFALLSMSSSAESFFAFHKVITENEGIQANPTKVVSSSFEHVYYWEQTYMNEIMQRYKNWCEVNKDQDFVNTKTINPNFQFALATVERSKIESSLSYDDILSELHGIFYTFYFYMDFLAIEMLDMREFVKSVYTRFTEDVTFRKIYEMPKTSIELKKIMRAYILAMLVQKYKLVPRGAYADTLEQKQKKEESFQKKVVSLNEEINNL